MHEISIAVIHCEADGMVHDWFSIAHTRDYRLQSRELEPIVSKKRKRRRKFRWFDAGTFFPPISESVKRQDGSAVRGKQMFYKPNRSIGREHAANSGVGQFHCVLPRGERITNYRRVQASSGNLPR